METEGSLPRLQQPATCPFLELGCIRGSVWKYKPQNTLTFLLTYLFTYLLTY